MKKRSQSVGGDRLVANNQAFFSTGLVTKAYKCVGILQPTDEDNSNFLPVDWTFKHQAILLVNGAGLGTEKQIGKDYVA